MRDAGVHLAVADLNEYVRIDKPSYDSFAQLRWIAIQHENTSLEVPFCSVMHTVTRNSRPRIPPSELSTREKKGAKLTTCSWYLTRLNIAYTHAIATVSKSGELKSFPSGRRARRSDCCLHQVLDRAKSLSIRSATASCRSSRNGASVGNPGETFRQPRSSRCLGASRLLPTGGGTLTGTPNRNYDHVSAERSTNSLVSRILFWRALCREFPKVTLFPVP